MDYDQLVGDVDQTGSIRRFVNWSRIDSENILTEAQAWIYGRLRVQEMIATDSALAIAQYDTSIAFPADYRDPIHLGIPGYINTIKMRDVERFRARLGWSIESALPVLPIAPPSRWCDIGRRIQFNARSDQAYTAQMVYYKTPAALSSSNTTNFLTDRYPSLLRYVCTKLAFEERKESGQEERYEAHAAAEIARINSENEMGLRGLELNFNWQATDDEDD